MNMIKNFEEFAVNEAVSPLENKLIDAVANMLYANIRHSGLRCFDSIYDYLIDDKEFEISFDCADANFQFTSNKEDWNKYPIKLTEILIFFPFDNRPMKVRFDGLVENEEIYDSTLFSFEEINEQEELIKFIDE